MVSETNSMALHCFCEPPNWGPLSSSPSANSGYMSATYILALAEFSLGIHKLLYHLDPNQILFSTPPKTSNIYLFSPIIGSRLLPLLSTRHWHAPTLLPVRNLSKAA
eukprot:c8330_g1_i1 orf=2-319(-)